MKNDLFRSCTLFEVRVVWQNDLFARKFNLLQKKNAFSREIANKFVQQKKLKERFFFSIRKVKRKSNRLVNKFKQLINDP